MDQEDGPQNEVEEGAPEEIKEEVYTEEVAEEVEKEEEAGEAEDEADEEAEGEDDDEGEINEDDDKAPSKMKVKNNTEEIFFDVSNNFEGFDNILLDVRLRKALLYIFKFKHPTKIQKVSIPSILKGNDTILNAKTGSGKTMAYLIPAIQRLIKFNIDEKEHLKFFYKCIIIAPTEELCLQIYNVGDKLCSYLKGIVTINHNVNNIFYEHPTILVSTPKHLCNYILEHKNKNNQNILSNLKILIIDEADVIHTKEFQKPMYTLTRNYLPKNFSKKYQIIMASATLKKNIIEKTNLFLHKPIYLTTEEDKKTTEKKSKKHPIDSQIVESSKKSRNNKTVNNEGVIYQGNDDVDATNFKFVGKSFYYLYDEELTKYIYLYLLIKNKTVKFKSIIFTASTADAYKIKIFLTYLNITSSILNPNHPILIKQNIILSFNSSKFYFLICPQFERNTVRTSPKESVNVDLSEDEPTMEELTDEKLKSELSENEPTKEDINNEEIEDELSDEEIKSEQSENEPNKEDINNEEIEDELSDEEIKSELSENEPNKEDINNEEIEDELSDEESVKEEMDLDQISDDNEKEEKDFLYNRGLDFRNVSCVINFNMPLDKETFLHRIGRTCRLNTKGISISFVDENKEIEKSIVKEIENDNICYMKKKNMNFNSIETYRYRVESTLNKCTQKKINLFIQKEILYHSLKSNELKEFFNSHASEKRKINKIIKRFNKQIISQKFIKDRNESIFLKKMTPSNTIKKNESFDKRSKNNNRGMQHIEKRKRGFAITQKGYEDQLKKEPNEEVTDPTKLPALFGKRLRNYMYMKYINNKKKSTLDNDARQNRFNGKYSNRNKKGFKNNKFSKKNKFTKTK
ncbi:ATP-dependent RNA helicase DBP9, putative [Plasmodium berghei]|uniref:RNA helicase n=2 Tax=Plasmodium berghei TaxID=5821 RepID=A0A509ASS7_PLABA|nr:ATP-dependent RNA helicase DBP9, putative [Plasmodium berghei ANKA]CXJ27175.1 ATP-dependent RNA helicase DBP9, putative [Plasmodium berghei]SCM26980.1 ATP-dependent RNA helicase DBP9, putative [Plasmodium berghei]SCN28733.1 ATP-dependent RNA helicase DBP9, putative [Plasmodium berghei]SCO62991.1 ATP-dependent RNA helicase DBP9, putative [Plasmodium berghei]SCO64480.1 ATP-dependent RNA helicase DBP9, putative [Plasmodium berghei]|eukprot:XP_034424379.1 ATP-dependent RNA helicase DBP9, putative [Plasmodium berghei ANKA]